ncbi:16650_t:CDS:2, partial [Racocetra fulgida]
MQLKICLEEIQKNHSEIISSVVLTILRGQGFFTDLQYLSDVLLPNKKAILAVEANCSTLADCYINLVKIAVAIQNLLTDEYKEFHQLEGLAKIYQFNLSNPIEQLCHTQTADIISEIISNIAETVFKEFEEETLTDNDKIEMLNPAEDLYPNEQDLDLSISTSIDFKSSVFTSSNSYESENFNEIKSDNDMQQGEYDVEEIVAAQFT